MIFMTITTRLIQSVVLCILGAMQLAQAQTVAVPAPVWKGLQYTADVLMDASGKQTLADVQNRFERGDSQPVSGNASQPLGGERTAWFRIKLPLVTSQAAAVVSVVHPGMDSVVLYTPVAEAAWRVQKSGDSIPVAQWAISYLHPAFAVDVSPTDVRPIYMAVRHSSPVGVYWQLWDRTSFDKQNKDLHMLLGGYMGFILLVVILSGLNAFNWRDPIHLIYTIYVVLLGTAQLSLTGLAGEYFWPDSARWNDMAAVVLPMFSAAWAALLIHRLVVERGNYRVSWLLISVMVMACAFSVAFLLLGRAPVFHLSNLAYLYFFVVLIGTMVWFSRRRPRVGLWALAGFLCLLAGSVFPIFRNLNWVPINFYTQFGAQIGAVMEIPLLLVALYFRSRERRDNQVRLGALSRVDPLTGVASQRLLLERLDHLLQRHKRDPQIGAVLRVRLANIAAIRAEGGLEAAQAAVVRAGACATVPALESDTVGRYLDGDFVVLLEGRSSASLVGDAAQRIIAEGLRQSRHLPGGVVLQLHVACADASMLKDDAVTLLERVGGVLDEIANQPTKPLRFLRERTRGQLLALDEIAANQKAWP